MPSHRLAGRPDGARRWTCCWRRKKKSIQRLIYVLATVSLSCPRPYVQPSALLRAELNKDCKAPSFSCSLSCTNLVAREEGKTLALYSRFCQTYAWFAHRQEKSIFWLESHASPRLILCVRPSNGAEARHVLIGDVLYLATWYMTYSVAKDQSTES